MNFSLKKTWNFYKFFSINKKIQSKNKFPDISKFFLIRNKCHVISIFFPTEKKIPLLFLTKIKNSLPNPYFSWQKKRTKFPDNVKFFFPDPYSSPVNFFCSYFVLAMWKVDQKWNGTQGVRKRSLIQSTSLSEVVIKMGGEKLGLQKGEMKVVEGSASRFGLEGTR